MLPSEFDREHAGTASGPLELGARGDYRAPKKTTVQNTTGSTLETPRIVVNTLSLSLNDIGSTVEGVVSIPGSIYAAGKLPGLCSLSVAGALMIPGFERRSMRYMAVIGTLPDRA